jgi:hypothetical protein
MWDCYEFGCGVDHETFEAENACAECAAAQAGSLTSGGSVPLTGRA